MDAKRLKNRVSGNGNGKAAPKVEMLKSATDDRHHENGQQNGAISMVIVELNGGAGLW